MRKYLVYRRYIQMLRDIAAALRDRLDSDRQARLFSLRTLIFFAIFCALAALIFPAWHDFRTDIRSSGAGQYALAALSHPRVALANLQFVAMSIAERFPLLSAVTFLLTLFVPFFALKVITERGDPIFALHITPTLAVRRFLESRRFLMSLRGIGAAALVLLALTIGRAYLKDDALSGSYGAIGVVAATCSETERCGRERSKATDDAIARERAVVLRGYDQQEYVVIIEERTPITRDNGPATLHDIQTNDRLVVIGKPIDDNTLQAKMITILP